MKLAKKLLRIREALGVTQRELLKKLAFGGAIKQQHISAWERGIREPDLLSLIKYARAVNVCLEVLVDDRLELPADLPCKRTYHPH